MPGYLLTWKEDPANVAELEQLLADFKAATPQQVGVWWRLIANARRGEPVLILRQGEKGKRGIFASGVVETKPEMRERPGGKDSRMAHILLTRLVDARHEALVDEAAAVTILTPHQLEAQQSGRPLEANVVDILMSQVEESWARRNHGEAVADVAGVSTEDEILTLRRLREAEMRWRPGQLDFRNRVFDAYGGRCAVTGCEAERALEAAHIWLPPNDEVGVEGRAPRRADVNATANGLLLRKDIHALFDADEIKIDPKTMGLVVDSNLLGSYNDLNGVSLRGPKHLRDHPRFYLEKRLAQLPE